MLSYVLELVNPHGGKIKGDVKISTSDSVSRSDSITDDNVRRNRQGMSRYMFRSFYGEDDLSKHPMHDVFKKSKGPKDFITKASKEGYNKDEIKEAIGLFYNKQEGKIKEDVVTKNSDEHDFVKTQPSLDIENDNILDIEQLKMEKPLLVRKVNRLVDLMPKNDVTGEELAIIVSRLLDSDVEIPFEYKRSLMKKLK